MIIAENMHEEKNPSRIPRAPPLINTSPNKKSASVRFDAKPPARPIDTLRSSSTRYERALNQASYARAVYYKRVYTPAAEIEIATTKKEQRSPMRAINRRAHRFIAHKSVATSRGP